MPFAPARSPSVPALLLPAVLAICGLSCCDKQPAGPTGANAPSRRISEFLGDTAVRTLSAPTRVLSFRLVSRTEGPASATAPTTAPADIQGFRVAASGPDLDPAFGSRLAAALFDPDSYQFNSAKGCIFDPGVAFRVWKGDEHVDVLLCFTCSEFIVYVPEAGGKARRAGEDFDDNRAAFVRLAKEAFPGDAKIQALK